MRSSVTLSTTYRSPIGACAAIGDVADDRFKKLTRMLYYYCTYGVTRTGSEYQEKVNRKK